MKQISILGSTGSIGRQTLEVVRRHSDKFKIVALAGHSNVDLLEAQVKEFKPEVVGISDEKIYAREKHRFSGLTVLSGADALIEVAGLNKADIMVAAVSGMAGFLSTLKAVECGKTVALANKESLVAGGKIIKETAKKTGAKIYPVDSEHSAVWQCLEGNNSRSLQKIILTASGGPLYGKGSEELKNTTIEQALAHPTWSMGKKISLDSATMGNKALEILEASVLFDTHNIDYVIHPESIVHSIVEFTDGTHIMQASPPSMIYPIGLALSYPDRIDNDKMPFAFNKPLNFLPKDEINFPLPKLAKQALKTHEGAPLVFNASLEAVDYLFLNKTIGFGHISIIVAKILEEVDFPTLNTAEDVVKAHNEVYEKVLAEYNK
ncbi:MAG: 1-deoxy-D-xylulose-5-phosphate reductoisomerase [Firmicutes bacterium]|nr:1-deoxy-D-xylulose-5-phosphate reductoisomerase [Bacillota bacterium]